jgi:hypothetical protein
VTTWVRTYGYQLDWSGGNQVIAEISPGQTLLRVHFGWGFGGETSAEFASMANVRNELFIFGLCTVPHGETVPNANSQRNDQAPPTQRWIYWEARPPVVAAMDFTGGGVVAWRDTGSGYELSTKGQVLATNLGGASSLDLYASWAATITSWDDSGTASAWFWASALFA